MLITHHILLDNEVTVVQRPHSFSGGHVVHSRLLVCPRCAQAWATLWVEGTKDCWPVAQFCKDHSSSSDYCPVPGSILYEEGWGVIDDELLRVLPRKLLVREFNLHLKAYFGE